VQGAVALYDSSVKKNGDYNVSTMDDRVVVMSKQLEIYDGEYAGVVKMDHPAAVAFRRAMDEAIEYGLYDQWYEDVLVQMIFSDNFVLHCIDIRDYEWIEVDSVRDLVVAKKISKR